MSLKSTLNFKLLLRPPELKKIWNDWSSINFHYSGPRKAQLVGPEFKIQVTRGVQNIQNYAGTPCMVVREISLTSNSLSQIVSKQTTNRPQNCPQRTTTDSNGPSGPQRTPTDPKGPQRTPNVGFNIKSLKEFIKCIPSILFTAQMQGMLGLWFRISVYQFARFLYVFFLVASKTSMQAWAWW